MLFINKRKSLAFTFLAFLLLLPLGQNAQAQEVAKDEAKAELSVLNAESFMLDNGMQVVVIPNHRAPVVTHMVWYKVGAADEGPGESGLAHFVEHLMFKGTEDVPPDQYSNIVRSLGGNHNAFTAQDYTAYYQNVAVEHLPKVMELEADRMNNLIFPVEHVISERQVVIEERRERTENDPRGYFYEQLQSALFTNHPYSNPVIGWFHELGALERPNVKAFYEDWYAPNNAILVVSGDITAEKLRPLAEAIYGELPKEDVPERNWTDVPPLLGLPKLTMRDPSIRQPVLYRLYRVPSYRQHREEALAMQVLEEIMSGSAATRLYKNLVVDQGVATSASMSYNPTTYSDSLTTISLVPAPDSSLDKLEIAFNDELRALIKDGVTEKEMAEAKKRLTDKTVFLLDDLSTPAMVFGRALVTGSNVEDVANWPSAIEAVTAEQVQQVAAKYLNPDSYGRRPYVTGYMLPPESTGRAAMPVVPKAAPANDNEEAQEEAMKEAGKAAEGTAQEAGQ